MKIQNFKIGTKLVRGYQIKLPKANLVLATTARGYICCGFLDLKTSDKLGDIACKVTGVRTINGLLQSRIIAVSSKAKSKGIKKGMVAREVIERFL
jgi:uncharacterized protein YunC (DUF1805 family)